MADKAEAETEEPEPQQEPAPDGQAIPGGVPGGGGYVQNMFGVPVQPSKTEGSSREQMQETPAMKADRAAIAQAGGDQATAEMEKAKIAATAQESANVLGADDAHAAWQHNIDRQAAASALQERIDQARQTYQERLEKAAAEPTSFWDDRTAGERTTARIGVWLSAFGAGISGGDNQAIKNINQQIEQDLKVKQARSERLFKLADLSSGMLADAYRARAEELGDMDAQRAAAHQVVLMQMEQIKNGVLPQTMVKEAEGKIAAWQQKTAESLRTGDQAVAEHVTKHSSTTIPLAGKAAAPAPIINATTGAVEGAAAPADAAAINKQNATTAELLGAIGDAKKILKENPNAHMFPREGFASTEASRALGQVEKRIGLAQTAAASTQGRWSPEKQRMMGAMAGAMGKASLHSPLPLLEQAAKVAQEQQQRTYNVHASGAIAPKVAPSSAATAPAPQTPSTQRAAIKAALSANPNDPKAKQAWKMWKEAHGVTQ